eukprot:CAMPEP_0181106020 /NCGR_PEP_ID=MMETSP1071-20121207/16302_1 /TAXON_ID=35127 /ORGANISM="Thalassiosira sp., Strain NH16" /LENGTH=171 /DNA_ID=CAMNT_0023189385 /DNA_START=124 /DNA_END=639 /DNA_ORIENTATION=+
MAEQKQLSSKGSSPAPAAGQPGFNQTKRRWARGFLWATALLLVIDRPLPSLLTSACAVYTMHGGTWLSHKNAKWMTASIISFVISLYAVTMRTESYFVDEERAYELKATLDMKHRVAELLWGGVLLLLLCLTVKERIDGAVEGTRDVVGRISQNLANGKGGDGLTTKNKSS